MLSNCDALANNVDALASTVKINVERLERLVERCLDRRARLMCSSSQLLDERGLPLPVI
jgi:hypothetical protein